MVRKNVRQMKVVRRARSWFTKLGVSFWILLLVASLIVAFKVVNLPLLSIPFALLGAFAEPLFRWLAGLTTSEFGAWLVVAFIVATHWDDILGWAKGLLEEEVIEVEIPEVEGSKEGPKNA